MTDFTEALADLRRRAAAGIPVTIGAPAADPYAVDRILIWDDLLYDPDRYRAHVLEADFQDIAIGPAVFHNIAPLDLASAPVLIVETLWPMLRTTVTFARKSPAGQWEPNYIHTDRDMGEWGAILYLTPDPPVGDGTTFWQHRDTGVVASDTTGEALQREWLAWRDLEQWIPWRTIAAKFNRLVLWPSALFHSRALNQNYGTGDDARLAQVFFGTGVLPCP